MTDKELLERIKKDPSEFSILFREYYRMIFGYVFRRVTDFDVSKDIVSDTFRKAFTHIKYFDYRGISIKVWLYRIAANELNLYFRHEKRNKKTFQKLYPADDSLYMQYVGEDRTNLELELEKHEQFVRISRELLTLPARYQEVLALRFFEGKQNREISEILNKNEGTVKSLISRGLALLREKCNDIL